MLFSILFINRTFRTRKVLYQRIDQTNYSTNVIHKTFQTDFYVVCVNLKFQSNSYIHKTFNNMFDLSVGLGCPATLTQVPFPK